MSMNTQDQINLTIPYIQSGVNSFVALRYNLPGEGTPKGFQFLINIRFMEIGKLTFLNVNDLVQEKQEA